MDNNNSTFSNFAIHQNKLNKLSFEFNTVVYTLLEYFRNVYWKKKKELEIIIKCLISFFFLWLFLPFNVSTQTEYYAQSKYTDYMVSRSKQHACLHEPTENAEKNLLFIRSGLFFIYFLRFSNVNILSYACIRSLKYLFYFVIG